MAILNKRQGTIVACCPSCDGARSSFEWKSEGKELGSFFEVIDGSDSPYDFISFRLFRCGGCGAGAFGIIKYGGRGEYPESDNKLILFYPEAKERLTLPEDTPKGIIKEFREAERCLENNCFRAASGLFRSVLDKLMGANGYETK